MQGHNVRTLGVLAQPLPFGAGSTGQFRLAEQIKQFCQELRPPSLALAGNLASVLFKDGGFHSMGVPQHRWFIRGHPIKMDDDWGYPYFRKPHMLTNMLANMFEYQSQAGKPPEIFRHGWGLLQCGSSKRHAVRALKTSHHGVLRIVAKQVNT